MGTTSLSRVHFALVAQPDARAHGVHLSLIWHAIGMPRAVMLELPALLEMPLRVGMPIHVSTR